MPDLTKFQHEILAAVSVSEPRATYQRIWRELRKRHWYITLAWRGVRLDLLWLEHAGLIVVIKRDGPYPRSHFYYLTEAGKREIARRGCWAIYG